MKEKKTLESVSLKESIVTKISMTNIMVFLLASLFILVGILTVNILYHCRKDIQTMDSYISNTMSSVDNALKDMGRVSLICFSDDRTQEVLREHSTDSFKQQLENEEYLKNLYTSLITIRNDINGVYIFDTEELIFYQDNLIPSKRRKVDPSDFMERAVEQEMIGSIISGCQLFLDKLPEFLQYLEFYATDPYIGNCLYLVRSIKSFSPYETIGHIVLAMPVSNIKNVLEEYLESGISYVLLTENKEIACSQNGDWIGCKLSDESAEVSGKLEGRGGNFVTCWEGRWSLISWQKSNYSGMYLLTAKPLASIFLELINLVIYCCVIALFFALFMFVMVYLLTRKGLRRVTELAYDLSSFEPTKLTQKFEIEKNDEIGQLKKSINDMLDTINNLMIAEYEGKMRLQEAKIAEQQLSMLYLKNQINPHFLYNTLDMIRIKAVLSGDKEVSGMLMQLVTFYRLSTKVDSSLVLVEHEIKMLNAYMNLMCCRYPKLKYETDIDESLHDVQIPNFMLQPLVENCILHGLRNHGYCGTVWLRITDIKEQGQFQIQIMDDGVGVSELMLARMNGLDGVKYYGKKNFSKAGYDEKRSIPHTQETEIPPLDKQGEMHIGIVNLQERLRYFYGEDCQIRFSNREKGGLCVTIRMYRRVKQMEETCREADRNA